MSFSSRWLPAPLQRAAGFLAISSCLVALSANVAEASTPASLLASSVTAQAGTGTIKGKLVWGGDSAPARPPLQDKGKATKDPQVCAKDEAIVDDTLLVDPKTKGVSNAFAYLVRPTGTNPEAMKEIAAKQAEVVVDQVNCRFIPHTVAVTVDQTVVFKSSDPTSHNLRYSSFGNGSFNQMMPANSKIEKKFVGERRPIAVACDIHPWMSSYLMVFDHPFFAVTGEDGSFEIKGVPAGAQKIVVWQEKVGYATPGLASGLAVTVKAGETTDIGEVKLDPAKVK